MSRRFGSTVNLPEIGTMKLPNIQYHPYQAMKKPVFGHLREISWYFFLGNPKMNQQLNCCQKYSDISDFLTIYLWFNVEVDDNGQKVDDNGQKLWPVLQPGKIIFLENGFLCRVRRPFGFHMSPFCKVYLTGMAHRKNRSEGLQYTSIPSRTDRISERFSIDWTNRL